MSDQPKNYIFMLYEKYVISNELLTYLGIQDKKYFFVDKHSKAKLFTTEEITDLVHENKVLPFKKSKNG